VTRPTFTSAVENAARILTFAEDELDNTARMDSLVGLANAWIELAEMVYTEGDAT
jgi:hypothetical protein